MALELGVDVVAAEDFEQARVGMAREADESLREFRQLWTRVDERTIVADARMGVEEVNQVLGYDVIPTDSDFETLGGFLLAELGEFPQAKTAVEFHNYQFIILEIKAHRLGRVRIVRREEMAEPKA